MRLRCGRNIISSESALSVVLDSFRATLRSFTIFREQNRHRAWGTVTARGQFPQVFAVVGEAEDGEEAIRLARKLSPDIVLMDLMMPGMDGVEATRTIREELPDTKVLILTTFGTSADVARAIAAGASGALVKDISKDDLVSAIRRARNGETVFSPEIEQSTKAEPDVPEFTRRQLDILHSVTRGLTNADIARQFGISTDGVKHHIMAIFKKLGATNRSEAVAIALRRQLLKN